MDDLRFPIGLFVHEGDISQQQLDWNAGNYAWHGNHHIAHITRLRERMGWSME